MKPTASRRSLRGVRALRLIVWSLLVGVMMPLLLQDRRRTDAALEDLHIFHMTNNLREPSH